jgi:hypothetical protein
MVEKEIPGLVKIPEVVSFRFLSADNPIFFLSEV